MRCFDTLVDLYSYWQQEHFKMLIVYAKNQSSFIGTDYKLLHLFSNLPK